MQSVLQNLFCRIISGKEFHTVTSRGTDKGKVVFFGHGNCLGGRGCLACQNRYSGADCLDHHICRDTSTGINHAFFQVNIMAQGITDGLIQSIMTSDIFALKEQFSATGKKTAVSCPGLAVKRGTIGETVCKIKVVFPEFFTPLISDNRVWMHSFSSS